MTQQGDPQMIAIPIFVVGSIALGTQLVKNWALGGPLAPILMATGLGLIVSAIWAAGVGQSYVACVAGLFGGFWLSYGIFVLGVLHDWWGFSVAAGTPEAPGLEPLAVNHAVVTFALSWFVIFVFLTISSIRLPVIYTLIFAFVCVALILVAIAYKDAVPNTDTLKIAGIFIWIFAGLGAYLFMTLSSLSLGGKAVPPIGPALLRPRPAGPGADAPRETQ